MFLGLCRLGQVCRRLYDVVDATQLPRDLLRVDLRVDVDDAVVDDELAGRGLPHVHRPLVKVDVRVRKVVLERVHLMTICISNRHNYKDLTPFHEGKRKPKGPYAMVFFARAFERVML